MSGLSFVTGALTWSLAEYLLHRFVGHGAKRRRGRTLRASLSPQGVLAEFFAEHTAHHAQPRYFAPTGRKALAAVVVGATAAGAATLVVGPRRGLAFAAGLLVVYASYEVHHRRIHTHAPTGPYTRWMRKHHWHHHRMPRTNHGVTSPLWDHVFGTHREPGRVPILRTVAPAWMVDAQGEVRADFRDDYELVGAGGAASAAT